MKQAEILATQTGNQQPEIGEQLIEREHIENTPFTIVGNKAIGYALVLGKYRISEFEETKDALIKWMNNNDWTIIMRMIGAMIDHNEEIKKEQLTQKQ